MLSMPTMRSWRLVILCLAAVLMALPPGASWAAPASITVDTLLDEDDGDLRPGDVSLREAIGEVADGGLIEFAPELSGGTIVLSLGQLNIRRSVAISGPGADRLTISGNDAQRVFSIDDGASASDQDVVITGVTVADGFAQGGNFTGDGAGIRNAERLTLEDCVISSNQSTNVNGGVFNSGNLTMARCEVRDNIGPFGAGIRNIGGSAEIRDTVVMGNYASAFGGGIDVCYGSLELVDSKVVGNEASRGGGIGIGGCPPTRVTIRDTVIAENLAGAGAGILNNQTVDIIETTIADNTGSGLEQQTTSAVATIERSTIAANSTGVLGGPGEVRLSNTSIALNGNESPGGFGIGTDGGVLTMSHVTISGNGSLFTGDGGGIGGGEGRLVTVESSIVAGNRAVSLPDCDDSVTVTSLGHNLFGDPNGCGALMPTDLVGEPGLAPYTDLGDPGTGHYPLLQQSQAIDAANPGSCPPEDQLGAPRPQGYACDIGAIEFPTGFLVVEIDVDPWDDKNEVDPGSPSLLAVALLSNDDFDALQVDLQSLRLSAGDARARNYRVYDVNRDRMPDLLAYFRLRDVQIGCGETALELTGKTYSGLDFAGRDQVTNRQCRGIGVSRITVSAHIDGRSQLILRGPTAQWHHLDFAAPGLHMGRDLPTVINGVEWFPEWPEEGENYFCNCYSNTFSGVEPPVPKSAVAVNLQVIRGRGAVTIVETPNAKNGYALVVEFDDNPQSGSADYSIELTLGE